MEKKKGMPSQNELVFCTVKRITPYAAWCDLDEYGGEGMIHISEVAGKWVHDIREFVKPNKQYVAKVMRVEPDRNIVSLSLKRVSARDSKEKINSVRRNERAQKILEQVAKDLGKKYEDGYEIVGKKIEEKFGELFSALEEIRDDPDVLKEISIPNDWKKKLLEIIAKSLKEKETVLKVNLEVRSYAKDGLENVKSFLKNVQESGSEVRYIAAGNYRFEITTKKPKDVVKKLREKFDSLTNSSKEKQVEFAYKFVKE